MSVFYCDKSSIILNVLRVIARIQKCNVILHKKHTNNRNLMFKLGKHIIKYGTAELGNIDGFRVPPFLILNF
jgi:hypothetical protein